MFFARPPALIMARCHSIKFFWPGVILIKFWIGERILDALWGGARFRVVAVFWVIPEHPTGLLADDDATTTTRNTKLASCLVRPRARANLAKTVSRCRIDPPAPRFASVWGGWHGKGRKKRNRAPKYQGRGNSTKIPSPRMDPAERPTDPGRRN